jgi:hypothetical protein
MTPETIVSEDAAEILCALIPALYVLTNRYRGQMVQTYQSGHFGCCAVVAFESAYATYNIL